jgi:hypothetical protein
LRHHRSRKSLLRENIVLQPHYLPVSKAFALNGEDIKLPAKIRPGRAVEGYIRDEISPVVLITEGHP